MVGREHSVKPFGLLITVSLSQGQENIPSEDLVMFVCTQQFCQERVVQHLVQTTLETADVSILKLNLQIRGPTRPMNEVKLDRAIERGTPSTS